MPFGVTNAPATFQSLINHIFKPYLRHYVLVFFDDILVYSPDLESHLSHLQQVFQLLGDHQLYVKASKCEFATTSVTYLGHIISKEHLLDWPRLILLRFRPWWIGLGPPPSRV